jgi:hypothetical protein
MRDKLYALLGIESGDKSMASMFLTQAILLGIFFGAYDITAHSLLLSTFDEKMMARGFIVSGIAGIILVSLYSRFRKRMQFKKVASISLCVVTILTLLLWSALIFSPSKLTIFIVYVMFGPLNILALLCFQTTADRLFPGGQKQRQRQLGDAAMIFGIIIISIIVPLLLTLRFRLNNILLVSVFSLAAATVIQILIGAKFSLLVTDETLPDTCQKKESYKSDCSFRCIALNKSNSYCHSCKKGY